LEEKPSKEEMGLVEVLLVELLELKDRST
jgi:hypothetical protein